MTAACLVPPAPESRIAGEDEYVSQSLSTLDHDRAWFCLFPLREGNR